MSNVVLKKILRYARKHVKHIFLTGGEPTLDPRGFELAEQNPDIIFFIFTNGSTMTTEYAKRLAGLGNLIPRLVGFPEKADLDFFLLLTTVQGLGVKKALRALAIPVHEVARAIELNDLATLKRLPEIGGKTAQKIVVELKGKAARFALLDEEGLKRAQLPGLAAEYQRDAVDILVQLQYTASEADTLVRQTVRLHPDIATAEELIQQIFKQQTRPK